jgi:hypothetical protein
VLPERGSQFLGPTTAADEHQSLLADVQRGNNLGSIRD